MKKITVALLSGGISSERTVSLTGGDQVFNALNKEKYRVIRYDPKTDLPRLVTDAPEIDVALIILHGAFGEDGTVQGLLDLLNIPYQGSGVLGSALAINKLASKRLYEQAGLPVPPYIVFKRNDHIDVEFCAEKIGLPMVIKPIHSGSSIGMSIIKSKNSFKAAIDTAFDLDDTILIERYIKGIELTAGVLGNESPEALPIIEIIPHADYDFFDYTAKYTKGATQEICPARISDAMAEKAKTYAKKAHEILFCKGYSRTDMILNNNELFILETNTIPGMTPTSLFPLAAKTAKISFSRLIEKLIELSM